MNEEKFGPGIDELLNKKFDFVISHQHGVREWTLPCIEAQQHNEQYKSERLQSLKDRLNSVKASLNDYDISQWHRHTGNTNPASNINPDIKSLFHPELCTQAWCKFHEILCFDEAVPKHAFSSKSLNTVHVCEAPGAFICSLNHYLKYRNPKVKYKWIGCTLNPYYEGNDPESCIADDRLIFHTTKRWCFGADNTGDVFAKSTLEELSKMAFQLGNIDLVTADGSFNCQEKPENQESDTACLKYTELLYALKLLGPGGTFVIKMFTMFESVSISLLYILCCTFTSVTVRKPATSKSGNSEVYVVARGFLGAEHCNDLMIALMERYPFQNPLDLDLFPISAFPVDFVTQHEKCVELFATLQIAAIERNRKFFSNKPFGAEFEEYKKKISQAAIETMEIGRINKNQCILSSGILKGNTHSNVRVRPRLVGTFLERNDPTKRHFHEEKHTENMRHKDHWLSWKSFAHRAPAHNFKLVFGKFLSTIRLSLFCDTHKLMKVHESWHSPIGTCKHTVWYSTDTKCGIARMFSEMTTTIGQPKVYELNVLKSSLCWRHILHAVDNELPVYQTQSLAIDSKKNLNDCCLLFVNMIADKYQHGCFRELSSRKDLMDVTRFILGHLPPKACLVVLLPSALTRLTAGLIWIICQCFEQYSLIPNACSDLTLPGLFLLCRQFKESGNWLSLLEIGVRAWEECTADQELLEIVPSYHILHDAEFSKSLKNCNHSLLSARLTQQQEFIL